MITLVYGKDWQMVSNVLNQKSAYYSILHIIGKYSILSIIVAECVINLLGFVIMGYRLIAI